MKGIALLAAFGVFLGALFIPHPEAEVKVHVVSAQVATPVVPYKVEVAPEPPPPPVKKEPKTYRVLARVSAYCPCAKCCGVMDGRTASNTNAWKPGVAADWSWLPRGTKVQIPGYGAHLIDDKGGLLKRRHWKCGTPRLDIRFKYHWTARRWGIKYITVTVHK